MKKGVIFGVVIVFTLFLSINFVSAGLVDWLKDFLGGGKKVNLAPRDYRVYAKFEPIGGEIVETNWEFEVTYLNLKRIKIYFAFLN